MTRCNYRNDKKEKFICFKGKSHFPFKIMIFYENYIWTFIRLIKYGHCPLIVYKQI